MVYSKWIFFFNHNGCFWVLVTYLAFFFTSICKASMKHFANYNPVFPLDFALLLEQFLSPLFWLLND